MIVFQRIVVGSGDEIVLHLRSDSHVVQYGSGVGILGVNVHGNWIRGLEIVGHLVNFSVGRAVKPFDPIAPSVPPHPPYPPGTVTCEEDNGYEMVQMYLLYDESFLRLPGSQRAQLLRIHHEIENPHCQFGLDSEGGLVYVRLPMADLSTPPEILLALLKKSVA